MSEQQEVNPKPTIDEIREKLIEIPEFGYVVLKKYTFRERCAMKGKMVKIALDLRTGQETPTIDTEAMYFWSVVYSVKSLPKHPEFYNLDEDQKQQIIADLGEEGELILKEAMQFNKLDVNNLKKK